MPTKYITRKDCYGTFKVIEFKKSEKYKYVFILKISSGETVYIARIGSWEKSFESERVAAVSADKYLLQKGRKAVNILKKVCKD